MSVKPESCAECGRTSSVVKLSESCPFCQVAAPLPAAPAPTEQAVGMSPLGLSLTDIRDVCMSQWINRTSGDLSSEELASNAAISRCLGEFKRRAALAARQAPTEAPKLDQEVSTDIMGAIARGWCAPINAAKVMDSDLAIAIAREVDAVLAARQAPDSRDAE